MFRLSQSARRATSTFLSNPINNRYKTTRPTTTLTAATTATTTTPATTRNIHTTNTRFYPLADNNGRNAQHPFPKSQPRFFATTTTGPHQPPLLPPITPKPTSSSPQTHINYEKYPQLKNIQPTEDDYKRWTALTWKWTKRGLFVYFVLAAGVTFGARVFAPITRNYVDLIAIDDIERNGSVSVWTKPLLFQDRAFTAHFDPKHPTLNHYYFRIFLLKEFEAAARAAEGIFKNSDTLIYNAALRVNLLKRVIERGWASQYDLTLLYNGKGDGPMFSSRALDDQETINQAENMTKLRQEYQAIANDQSLTFEEKLKLQLDPRFHTTDRIDLSKQQLIYIQQGIEEFDRLADVGFKLQSLAIDLRAVNMATLWKLRNATQEWSFPFDTMTNEYHQLASSAAATARLNDSLYILSTQNVDQILSFMRYFDKNIQLLNNPEQIQKNKFALPVFPKLTFDVISTNEYSAQLATIQSQFRLTHDPTYDPNNPRIIRNEAGVVLNPEADPSSRPMSSYNRDFIPYTSPGRPYDLPHHHDLDLMKPKFILEPTFEDEVAYSQNYYQQLRADGFGEAMQVLGATWRRHRNASTEQEQNDAILKKHIKQLGAH